MFTGIVEEMGRVQSIEPSKNAIRLSLLSTLCGRKLKKGDSLAVNGCCLTLTGARPSKIGKSLCFDLLQETWDRTNFKDLRLGAGVNLERPVAADGRMGGHFVTGHIDGTGLITRWEKSGTDWVLEVEAPPDIMRYVLFKGSIAVDGISLTVAACDQSTRIFRIWIIPHTYEVTALKERSVGQWVNLEADLIGKYVAQFFDQKNLAGAPSPRGKKKGTSRG